MGCLLEAGKAGEVHQSSSPPNQAFQHHLCDSASLWMWILGYIRRHRNKINAFATVCYRIMLNIKRLDCVNNERIYHPTPHQHCKAASTTRFWDTSLGCLKRCHAEDMPCMFQLTPEGDQDGRGQATYRMYKSFLRMQRMIWTKMQLPH